MSILRHTLEKKWRWLSFPLYMFFSSTSAKQNSIFIGQKICKMFPFIIEFFKDVLYNNKMNGGIGLIDVFLKAKSIYIATILKNFCESKKSDIIQYYMALRLNTMFGITTLPSKFSYSTTSYYEQSMDLIRKCYRLKDFPNIKPKEIYNMICPITQPNVEKLYLNFNWKNIWKNINFRYINIYDRHVLFKYIHEILPNNKKLAI